MSEIQVVDKPVKGQIALVQGQIPLIVVDKTPVIQTVTLTVNGTYVAPSGVDGYSPITVNVNPFITGSITPTTASNSITLTTTKKCSHVIIYQHIKTSTTGVIAGQVFSDVQIASELGDSIGVGSVVYNDNSIVITNTTGVYSTIQYDWMAW